MWISGSPAEGAKEFIETLSKKGVAFCLLTNDCSVSKVERHNSLTRAGLILSPEQLLTAAEVTREWLENASMHSIMYLGSPDALRDVTGGFSVRQFPPVDAVVVGDLFVQFDRIAIDKAAKAIIEGAILVAMQRNQRWSDGADWHVDNGFWIAGFEYVTGQQAVVTGKPSAVAYRAAISRLSLDASATSDTLFVSDDVLSDLKGAKEVGLTTVFFGKLQDLPAWVDYQVADFSSLRLLVLGETNE